MSKQNKHIKLDSENIQEHSVHQVIALALLEKYQSNTGPVLIVVGGPGGIGKSTFAKELALALDDAVVLSLDDYKTSRQERKQKNIFGPHPDANEMDLIRTHLGYLRENRTIDKPCYCSERGQIHTYTHFVPKLFVLVEGEVSTYQEFRQHIDFAIFIDSHWKTQLNTRITRDVEERGYTPEKAIATFLHSNLIEFPQYGEESKNWCDVHIHCQSDYSLVIDAVDSENIDLIKKYTGRIK
jgi:uridine kinase